MSHNGLRTIEEEQRGIDVWENEKLIAKSSTFGHRDVWDDESLQYNEIPVTFEEVMKNMKEVKDEHL